MDMAKIFELLISGLGGIAASFAGAYYAFRWNREREERNLLDAKVDACNKAVFILSEQLRVLTNFRDQNIAPVREHPGRHFVMGATLPIEALHLRLDAASLSFLFETSAAEVPPFLAIENARFHSLVSGLPYHAHGLSGSPRQP
ncbi:MAG: hypothetical protein JWQ76_4533 [Ramlibacter sp.]|nr:hypothetical protein [Ramlibacter sp.]